MSKAKMIGYNKPYIPNSCADRRCKPAIFRRCKYQEKAADNRAVEKREREEEKHNAGQKSAGTA